ncbi:Carboxypeptidase E [Armadillidium vulgare]|nr:Carboxypeptidase E [Armadillidium vulgare]
MATDINSDFVTQKNGKSSRETEVLKRGGENAVAIPPSDAIHKMTHEDRLVFETFGKRYSNIAEMPQTKSPCSGKSLNDGVTTDFSIHPTSGSLLDYLHHETSAFGFNIYYSCSGIPNEAILSSLLHKHRSALVKTLSSHDLAVIGAVTDQSGRPIEGAPIKIEGSDHITYSGNHGGFWRLISPGHHSITVDTDGYFHLTRLVEVNEGKNPTPVMLRLSKDTRVAGLPRMVFIIIAGSTIMMSMLLVLCCVTIRSRQKRIQNYGFKNLPQNLEAYNDSTSDDEFETLYVKSAKEPYVGKSNLFKKKKEKFSAPYHDVPFSSSSDDEDDVFISSQKPLKRVLCGCSFSRNVFPSPNFLMGGKKGLFFIVLLPDFLNLTTKHKPKVVILDFFKF